MMKATLLLLLATWAAVGAATLTEVGRWRLDSVGVNHMSVSADGSTAYVCSEDGLYVFDVTGTDPVVTRSEIGETCRFHVLGGGHVYNADPSEVRIYDVSDPAATGMVKRFDAAVESLGWYSGYLYIGLRDMLAVYDVSDPANPVFRRTVVLGVLAPRSLTFVGGYLYVNFGVGGFEVYDVSDPSNPVKVVYAISGLPSASYFTGVAQQGDWVFAVYEETHGMVVLNVANPAAPTVAATWSSDVPAPRFKGIVVVGDTAFLLHSAWQDDRIIAADVTDPTVPTQIAEYDPEMLYSYAIAAHGNRVYVGGKDGVTAYLLPPSCTTGVKVNGVPASPVPLVGSSVTLSGLGWTGFQSWMGGMTAYEVPTPVPAMSTVELTCCGGEVCEFFVALYTCAGCTGARPAGLAHTLALDEWRAGSCSPQFGDGFGTTGFWRKVDARSGEQVLTYTAGHDEILAVFGGAEGTAPEPWCPKPTGPLLPPSPGGLGCAARCPEL